MKFMLQYQAMKLTEFSKPIRDPIWNHIWMNEQLFQITQTPDFLRLYNIKQLGPSYMVYPGASHTRASHSIGVYATALKMISMLLKKGADNWLSEESTKSFLAAALLHDLGHFPFTHSLKELNIKEHEILTGELILKTENSGLIAKTGANPEQTAAIVTGEKTNCCETKFLQKLLSGVLDPDKLDYLNRDAFYCGVPYGIQDTDFIFSQIIPDKNYGIKIESKAIISVENILFSKYLMYKAVYWHKDIRIATAMMKKAIYAALKKNIFLPEDLYHQDDSGIFALIEKYDYPEKLAAEQLKRGKIYKIVLEIPFNINNKFHVQLENLDYRYEEEKILAEIISQKTNIPFEKILIDIPERISFESELFIEDEQKIFTDSSTVFSKKFIENLVPSLRKIRLAISEDEYDKIGENKQVMKKLKERFTGSL